MSIYFKMKGELHFKEMIRKGNQWDDGSLIYIKGQQQRGSKHIIFSKRLIQEKFPKAEFVTLFFSEEGYLGFKFSEEPKPNSYKVKEYSMKKLIARCSIAGKFHNQKYFKDDIEWQGDLLCVKVDVLDTADVFAHDLEEDLE